ncbi:hypothetical protein NA57DRAFT_60642 [Rhizodiscina lignyota]|uniref:Uncharacterized protein n=1 Tax=Rhizodiscina lignyota TaxID=1504668 RepID=A0A9P4M4U4_9PEZI|nr:hypothetical protein NA57DRAFT_60642 [Rhizodiscina lignyota]
MSFLDAYNKSFLAIPAYYVLSIFPHSYAVALASGGNLKQFDNQPRTTNFKKRVQESLPPETFAKYERAEAAHYNGMENLPLFAAAVILGNLAGLEKSAMDRFVGAFLALRAAYFVQYISNSKKEYTWIRTVLWMGSVALSIRTIVQAAKAMGSK